MYEQAKYSEVATTACAALYKYIANVSFPHISLLRTVLGGNVYKWNGPI